MTDKQPEALRLADIVGEQRFAELTGNNYGKEAAAELRRLHEENTALRERLEQPEQEPVAWGMRDINGNIYDCISVQEHTWAEGSYDVPLYTTPPRRDDTDAAYICHEIHKNGGTAWDCWYTLQARSRK